MFKLAPNSNTPVFQPASVFSQAQPQRPRRATDFAQLTAVSPQATPVRPAAGPAPGSDLMFIWRRKGWIISGVLISLVAGIAAEFVLTARYRAAAQILIGAADLRVIDKSVLPQAQANDTVVIQVESQTRVLTSDKVLRRVVQTEHLVSDPEFGGRGQSLFRQTLLTISDAVGKPINRRIPASGELAALWQLQRAVTARRTDKTSVIELVVETTNPAKSASIANAIVQAYTDESSASRSDVTRRATESLSSRLSELKERVRAAEELVERYKAENNIVGASGRLVNEQQLTDLNNQLSSAKARTSENKARYDQMQLLLKSGADAGSTTEAVQSNTIGRLREQYAAAARQEANLTAQLGTRHPWLAEAHAQVRDAQRLITEELNRIASAYYNDYIRAKSYEDSLNSALDELKQRQMGTSLAFVKMRELEREAEASRVIYEQFLTRSRETREQESLDTVNVRVLSDAQPPQERSWPPRTLFLIMGAMVVGLPVSLVLAYIADIFHRRIRPTLRTLLGAVRKA